MVYKKVILRIFRVAGLAALAVALLTFMAVQIQQWMLRWRAERLMADMHRIRLYQSTWADAQRLMNRWGTWGHYDGSCTAESCRYEIDLMDASWQSWDGGRRGIGNWLLRHHAPYVLYHWLGGRYAIVHYAFIVQDGTIWRTSTWVNISVAPEFLDKDDFDYVLIVGAKSKQALRQSEGSGWVLGRDEQLAEHPYYKAGRPGGCEGCLMAGITYSAHTPQSEIVRLTSFDFSCLTRLISCKRPEDLLPVAREWHLYDYLDSGYQEPPYLLPSPYTCNLPLWAVARDAGTVVVVDALSISEAKENNHSYELTKVRVDSYLKGASHWSIGSVINVGAAWQMTPGKRYVILPSEFFYGIPDGSGSATDPIFPFRCGVQEDTPEVRRELEKGFAQNDNLRGPELR
jgi:hypothetical protein